MDTMRGNFGFSEFPDDSVDFDLGEDENIRDLPPAAIGQDERRMQVRAYNHWAGMLGDRNFPSVEELEPQNLEDFGPYSVLLDFSLGIEDPAVQYLGDKLAAECGADYEIGRLSDVPSRSLLSRITDHYMQILANQAPIGFEAEFVNQRDITILYRGILLPFSSDNETIDFIYGVINWKEMADAAKADELLLEIDQALETEEVTDMKEDEEPLTLTELAPANDSADEEQAEDIIALTPPGEDIEAVDEADKGFAQLTPWSDDDVPSIHGDDGMDEDNYGLPEPAFGDYGLGDEEEEDEANYSFASLTDHVDLPSGKSKALDLDELGAQQALNPEGLEVSYDEGSFDAPLDGEPNDRPFDVELDAPEFGEPNDVEDFAAEPEAEAAPVVEDVVEETEPEAIAEELNDEAVAPTESPLMTKRQALLDPAEELEEAAASQDKVGEFEQEELPEDAGLYDYLADARELAHVANDSEDRSRSALYAAVGRAFDVALAAEEAPEEYNELLAENGLVAQARAPMTPVVKLVFGADYDKTRLTEYAAVLSYARRIELERGQLEAYLGTAEGGLKGVVQTERRLRREEAGKKVEPSDAVRSAIAEKLREMETLNLTDLPADGGEFGLVMIRRTEEGEIVVLGELEQDIPLIERAARKLLD